MVLLWNGVRHVLHVFFCEIIWLCEIDGQS